jgi:hypothetical protein
MLSISRDDEAFRDDFEAGRVAPEAFTHREHVRLAYTYLCELSVDDAYVRAKRAILALLERNRLDAAKYHETLTLAWLKAVRHFMNETSHAVSSHEFLERNARLLNSRIMLSHYSEGRLFSEEARASFIDPDIEPIP